MQKAILFSIAAGAALAAASAAGAQGAPGIPAGGVRSQDVAASNRQIDSDYNTLAGRGVKVTDKSRADAKTDSRQKRASVALATAADIKAGAQVRDIKGVPVGTIANLASNEVAADPNQAVIDTGQTKIGVPLSALGKDDKGLLLGITADKFKQLVAQAHANNPAAP
jgi:hypothetical protein